MTDLITNPLMEKFENRESNAEAAELYIRRIISFVPHGKFGTYNESPRTEAGKIKLLIDCDSLVNGFSVYEAKQSFKTILDSEVNKSELTGGGILRYEFVESNNDKALNRFWIEIDFYTPLNL